MLLRKMFKVQFLFNTIKASAANHDDGNKNMLP
uniref:Uncharacterized protein n=1 Tax=Arundo donax TaxID=35708 RepID=A0A0A9BD39_ARUDO